MLKQHDDSRSSFNINILSPSKNENNIVYICGIIKKMKLTLSHFLLLLCVVSLYLCNAIILCPVTNDKWASKLKSLERQYRSEREHGGNLTIIFGHIHHAGGTAVCQLARHNTMANPSSNCNHPNQWSGINPITSTIADQLEYQRTTRWKFYAVELKMPEKMIFGGPFLYSLVMRHPFVLLLSQQRRAKLIHNLDMNIKELVKFQIKKAGGERATETSAKNTLRGQAGFILGKYGPTNMTDGEIFEATKRRIDRFSVLLLTEDMENSGKLFNIKFGWNVSNFGKKRVNSHGDWDELIDLFKAMPLEDKQYLKWVTAVDMKVYDYARCVVQRELANVGMSLGVYSLSHFDELISKVV